MVSETLVKCGHPPCQCLIEAEQKFCSAACSSARGTASVPCSCGHPGCIEAGRLVDDIEDDEPLIAE
jgi:hypothetical protein